MGYFFKDSDVILSIRLHIGNQAQQIIRQACLLGIPGKFEALLNSTVFMIHRHRW